MNLQEQFDHVVSNLRKQRVASTVSDPNDDNYPGCAYRGENCTKCAAGHLIPDDRYHEEMENVLWEAVVDSFKDVLPDYLLSFESRELVAALQNVHDNLMFVKGGKTFDSPEATTKFKIVANKYKLEWNFE